MKTAKIIFITIFLVSMSFLMKAQNIWADYERFFQSPRNYVVYQTNHPVIIDGKADEDEWKYAVWTEEFTDIEGSSKPKPLYPTHVKMLWDKQALYLLAEITEPNIWAYYRQHDQIVYQENDFEIFIDPDKDTQNYFEFELNAANTLFDLFMTKPYRSGGIPLINWDAPKFKSAVFIDGTINNPSDTDQKWTIEMAIPFEDLRLGVTAQIPENGQTWKINFSRVNWQTQLIDGKYQKKKDEKTGHYLSEYNWVWSPTGEINMHVPERWGLLQFSSNPINSEKNSFRMSEEENLQKYLWLVFYKEQNFRKTNGKYASTLPELSIYKDLQTESGKTLTINLLANDKQFTASLITGEYVEWSINEQGLLQKVSNKQ